MLEETTPCLQCLTWFSRRRGKETKDLEDILPKWEAVGFLLSSCLSLQGRVPREESTSISAGNAEF